MNEQPTIEALDTYARTASYVEEPAATDYSAGVVPLDTLPAAWWNYFLRQLTSDEALLATNLNALYAECISVLNQAGITPDSGQSNQLYAAINIFIQNKGNELQEQIDNEVDRATESEGSIQSNLTTHISTTTTPIHGSSTSTTANTLIHRDGNGRAQVASPSSDEDIANKVYVDDADSNLKDQIDDLQSQIDALVINYVYPVGSIYWSTSSTNPGTLFGGTWTQITDRFIMAAGAAYTAGSTGGSTSVTLDHGHMVPHRHMLGTASFSTQSQYSFMGFYSAEGGWTTTRLYVPYDEGSYNNASYSDQYMSLVGWRNAGQTYSPVTASPLTEGTIYWYNNGAYIDSTTINDSPDPFSIIPPYVAYYCWRRTA